jgi:phage terminase large subunit-like protein
MTPAELAYFAPATAEEALSADDMEVFIPIELWDACYDPMLERMPLDPDTEGLAGSKTPVVIAVDAASTHDSFGIVALTRHPVRHDEVAVRGVRKWDPPKKKGGEIDYSGPETFLRDLINLFNVQQIAYDPYQLTSMMQRLRRETAVRCREFNQQKERLVADRGLYDLIVNRRITHDGNALVREHMQNAAAQLQPKDDSKLRIIKRAPDKKIDLVICISMGAKECLRLNI